MLIDHVIFGDRFRSSSLPRNFHKVTCIVGWVLMHPQFTWVLTLRLFELTKNQFAHLYFLLLSHSLLVCAYLNFRIAFYYRRNICCVFEFFIHRMCKRVVLCNRSIFISLLYIQMRNAWKLIITKTWLEIIMSVNHYKNIAWDNYVGMLFT